MLAVLLCGCRGTDKPVPVSSEKSKPAPQSVMPAPLTVECLVGSARDEDTARGLVSMYLEPQVPQALSAQMLAALAAGQHFRGRALAMIGKRFAELGVEGARSHLERALESLPQLSVIEGPMTAKTLASGFAALDDDAGVDKAIAGLKDGWARSAALATAAVAHADAARPQKARARLTQSLAERAKINKLYTGLVDVDLGVAEAAAQHLDQAAARVAAVPDARSRTRLLLALAKRMATAGNSSRANLLYKQALAAASAVKNGNNRSLAVFRVWDEWRQLRPPRDLKQLRAQVVQLAAEEAKTSNRMGILSGLASEAAEAGRVDEAVETLTPDKDDTLFGPIQTFQLVPILASSGRWDDAFKTLSGLRDDALFERARVFAVARMHVALQSAPQEQREALERRLWLYLAPLCGRSPF